MKDNEGIQKDVRTVGLFREEKDDPSVKELRALLNNLLDYPPEFRKQKYSPWFLYFLSRFRYYMYTRNYLEAKNDLSDIVLYDINDPRIRWHIEEVINEFSQVL